MNFKNNIISKIKIIISLIFSLIFIACGGNKNQNKSYAEDNLKTVTKQTNEPVLEDESPKSQINENITIDKNANVKVIDVGETPDLEIFINDYKKEKLTILDKNLKSELLDNFFQHYKNTEFLFSLNKNDVLNIFGKPDLNKNEEGIEIWQYRDNACVLNFIWNQSVLRHLKSYDFENKEVDVINCIISLAKIKN
jgi:hypothetical protein